MVLDVKAMEWAAENGVDTAKLKAAKVPIYGKWYFPDLPAGVPLVNLKTGEILTFGPGLRAGEVLFVTRADLRRARLGPYSKLPDLETEAAQRAATQAAQAAATPRALPAELADRRGEEEVPEGIHLPGPSIFPLVLGLGIAIMLLGVVVGGQVVKGGTLDAAVLTLKLAIVGLGFIYVLVGGVGWAMDNHQEGRERA